VSELRILIADDHPLVRRGVRDLLSTRVGWEIVGEACDGADAVRQAMATKPDVAILDFSMPELNGSAAAASICRHLPGTAVVVLTMHDSDEVIHEVLRSGARGLVLKSDADRTLLGAVEAAAEKRQFFTERANQIVLGAYLTEKTGGSAKRRGAEPRLTERESEVMRLLAEGMTNKEAAQALRISIRTVESHRNNLSRKLGLGSLAELVRYAVRNGIVGEA
jgi:DNA-binding NarL/FixJ family response regulator